MPVSRDTLVGLLDAICRASGGREDVLRCPWQNVPQELVPGQSNLSRKRDEPRSQTPGGGWDLCHVAQSNDFESGWSFRGSMKPKSNLLKSYWKLNSQIKNCYENTDCEMVYWVSTPKVQLSVRLAALTLTVKRGQKPSMRGFGSRGCPGEHGWGPRWGFTQPRCCLRPQAPTLQPHSSGKRQGWWQGLLWTSCHFGRENKLTTLPLPFCPLKISRNFSVSKLLTCDNNRRVNSKTWFKLCLGCRADKTNANASI